MGDAVSVKYEERASKTHKPSDFIFKLFSDKTYMQMPEDDPIDTVATSQVQEHILEMRTNAKAVVKVMTVFTPAGTTPTPRKFSVGYGTVFYVAPTVLVTAKHTLEKEGCDCRHIFISPKHQLPDEMITALVDTPELKFDLNGEFPRRCNDSYAEEGIYYAEEMRTNTQALVSLASETGAPLPFTLYPEHVRNKYSTFSTTVVEKTWGYDVAFLKTEHTADNWLVPSAVLPEKGTIALVAYSSTTVEQQVLDQFYGEDKITADEMRNVFLTSSKFVSPGKIQEGGTIITSFAHTATSEKGSSGGPIFAINTGQTDTFIGMHVGCPELGVWNNAICAQHPRFVLDWFECVYPEVEKALGTLEGKVLESRRAQLLAFLSIVREHTKMTRGKPKLTKRPDFCNCL